MNTATKPDKGLGEFHGRYYYLRMHTKKLLKSASNNMMYDNRPEDELVVPFPLRPRRRSAW